MILDLIQKIIEKLEKCDLKDGVYLELVNDLQKIYDEVNKNNFTYNEPQNFEPPSAQELMDAQTWG